MASKYTEEEILAIDRKMEFPEKDMVCPRCGSNLTYTTTGNSFEVKCQTKDCLIGRIRGL